MLAFEPTPAWEIADARNSSHSPQAVFARPLLEVEIVDGRSRSLISASNSATGAIDSRAAGPRFGPESVGLVG